MDLASLLTLKKSWNTFKSNHPKFAPFLKAAKPAMTAGSIVDVTITTPEGRTISTNLRLTQSDMDLVETLRELAASQQS